MVGCLWMFVNVYQMAGEVCSRSWLVLLFLILLALGYCVVSVCQTNWQLFPHLVVQGVWRVTGGARITIANHSVVFLWYCANKYWWYSLAIVNPIFCMWLYFWVFPTPFLDAMRFYLFGRCLDLMSNMTVRQSPYIWPIPVVHMVNPVL